MHTRPRTLLSDRSILTVSALLILLASCAGRSHADLPGPSQLASPEWVHWRGPLQNNTAPWAKGLPAKWNPKGGPGSNVLWKRDDLATRSTPIVMYGKLYTLCRADPGEPTEGERVVCVDAVTGKPIWENRFNVYLSDVPDVRVAWSCVAGDPLTGNVYALGVCGYFQCLDGRTGKTLWSHSMHEEYGLLSTYGGRTNVPIFYDDLVIISAIVIGWGDMAKPAHRFIAFDKKTGEVVWFNGTRLLPYDTNYSTPTVTPLHLVFGSGDGAVWGMHPGTGRGLWKYQLARRGLNVSPLVVGNRVYLSHSEENIDDNTMGALVAIDSAAKGPKTKTGEMNITKTGELWRVKQIMAGKSSPMMVDGKLVVVDDRATFIVFDPKTGKQLAKKKLGTMMRSTPLYADGKIFLCTANGRWYTLALDGNRVKTLHKMRLPSGSASHGSPIVANGRLYVPTTGALYCIEGPNRKEIAPDDESQGPLELGHSTYAGTQVQLIPAESLIRPGESIKFRARLFEGFLKTSDDPKVTYSLDGPGEITKDGKYTAPSGNAHSATIVKVKVGDVVGTARIRVVPPLPWKFDFDDGNVPITWVGARYRHQVRDLDGNKVIVKVSTIPKGARSRGWMGHPDLSNYTIAADVRGAVSDRKMPDIGLIAQRYTLDLRGADQSIQIRSWVPVMRMAVTEPFEWKPDTWYRMKFRAAVEESGGKKIAVLRGKVWPKGEPEPDAWTIEATDEAPNLNGSPGLYGNAKNAELYLDNLTVTANE